MSDEVTRIAYLGAERIIVGRNIVTTVLPKDLHEALGKTPSRYAVIVDETVRQLHWKTLEGALHIAGVKDEQIVLIVVPPGEHTKSREWKQFIEDKLLERKCNRDTVVLALGGGVVGDLGGFVAATFLRGVPVVQIPTTLLAMVDSSIGGKTGIDTRHGKNLLGAFHQPSRVYIDLNFLKTLPLRHLRNGMAEVVKTFAIQDADMFSQLEQVGASVLSSENVTGDAMRRIVERSAGIKADIVNRDEKEGGLRGLLNFGHTIGHAVESLKDFALLHGECVAIGIVKECEVARAMGHLPAAHVGRCVRLLTAIGLPTKVPEDLTTVALLDKIALDKKTSKGGSEKRCVILTAVGETLEPRASKVSDEVLRRVLSPHVCVVPSGPASGKIRVPGSKSLSNRSLLLTAMGTGDCEVVGLLHSDDTQVMMDSLTRLGAARFEWKEQAAGEDPTLMVYSAEEKRLHAPSQPLYLGNAGTATRFLCTLCTLVDGGSVEVTGNERMGERPIKDLTDALIKFQGCKIKHTGKNPNCPPLLIEGTGLSGGEVRLRADTSSQYVSSILLSAPYAKTPMCLVLEKDHPIVSQPYIDMTLSVMEQFGVRVDRSDENHRYFIPTLNYKNPNQYEVEADASSATYPLAIAAITGGDVTTLGVGSTSLQGDAEFYSLLEKMGCEVEQTETETRVKGPSMGSLRAISVDMNTMTDAFMTLCAVAAVAEGTTVITGIANQRVKECNRIEAMRLELAKIGVTVRELDDGLEIDGQPDISKLHGATVHTYDDHRIAMSFAVLGCVVPGIIITHKECTAKTYPQFWDDIGRTLGVQVVSSSDVTGISDYAVECADANESLVIIGMRGAGKSTLSVCAAESLGWKLIDVDAFIEEKLGKSIKDYVASDGWEAFRSLERQTMRDLLEDGSVHRTCHVISCGGGVVESEELRSLLKTLHRVVHVWRDIDDITDYLLGFDKTRPTWGEHPAETFERRLPWYRECSSHEFKVRKGDLDMHRVSNDFERFVRVVAGDFTREFVRQRPALRRMTNVGAINNNTFFVCLTHSSMSDATQDLPRLVEGADVIELRADLLACTSADKLSDDQLLDEVATLRANDCGLPVIFTVRSTDEGGKYKVRSTDELTHLLSLGVRSVCEYIDVEAAWPPTVIASVCDAVKQSGTAQRVIGSQHNYLGGLTEHDIANIFRSCALDGRADIVKVVLRANSVDDVLRVRRVIEIVRSEIDRPIIALCVGEKGQLSRVLNDCMTPVTHLLMPTKAAPGQLSSSEIQAIRHRIGMSERRQLFLFGHPITHSPSPAMHNCGAGALGVPLTYALCDSNDITHISECLSRPETLGGSVTIPHKQSVRTLLQYETDVAKTIGAVNTVFRDREGRLCGDNTDWIGIVRALGFSLSKRTNDTKGKVALVIGAGGTARAACYALQTFLGFETHVINRTLHKAEKLVEEFSCAHAHTLDETLASSLSAHNTASVIVGTLPADVQSTESFPETLFSSDTVVLDAAYKPARTPLLEKAESCGAKVVFGREMLIYQGIAQLEIWTGKPVPQSILREAVLAEFH